MAEEPMRESGIIDRVANRMRSAGVLATVEDPRAVARIGVAGLLFSIATTAMTAAAFLAFDEPEAAIATAALCAAFAAIFAWQVFGSGPADVRITVTAIVVAAAANHVTVHVALGGYANSGGYLAFGILATMVATMALSRVAVAAVAGFYASAAIVLGLLDSRLAAGRLPPDPRLSSAMAAAVLATDLLMLVAMFGYLLGRLKLERARAEALLLNVLPAVVAAELKERGVVKPRRFESISVLFADIVGFTPMSGDVAPEQMVEELNTVFTHFDELADRHQCEKIRTIGDAYMVAAGVPEPRPDHAEALARMALEITEYCRTTRFQFRIGINSGPAVAGVIGRRKFQYDVWGDTVNLASRMESHGIPGEIQVTTATRDLLGERFRGRLRGTIEVKGKGALETWILEGIE
ncbi:MAG TPA: adenylate/guanylate cyclase domain-containing protein [Acidimicrobiia bacterium]|nr:adenylate/guanylate cyclase domain-containing protein [Acidimicrobiia bacterium]